MNYVFVSIQIFVLIFAKDDLLFFYQGTIMYYLFNMKLGPVVKVMASSCFAYILRVVVMPTTIMIHFNVKFLFGFCLDVFKNTYLNWLHLFAREKCLEM